jgi:hypothetical protein
MRIGSVLTHAGEALFEGLLLSLLVVALIVGTAFAAGKGGGNSKPTGGATGTSTISAPVLVTDVGTPGLSFGDTITFTISTTATTTPWVKLQCTQNGDVVATGTKGFWDGSIDVNWDFVLSSPSWKSGAADCVAALDKQTKQGWQQLASTSFYVGP